MPSAPGTLTYEQGRLNGAFQADDGNYLFIGALVDELPPFRISNARVTFDSTEQVAGEKPFQFEELPVERDHIHLKMKNGVEISGSFDTPYSSDHAVEDWRPINGSGGWFKGLS